MTANIREEALYIFLQGLLSPKERKPSEPQCAIPYLVPHTGMGISDPGHCWKKKKTQTLENVKHFSEF